MSHEWSRVVSAEVKKEYMTLHGIQNHCSQLTSQNTKTVKSHLSLTLMRVKLVYMNINVIDYIICWATVLGRGSSLLQFYGLHNSLSL